MLTFSTEYAWICFQLFYAEAGCFEAFDIQPTAFAVTLISPTPKENNNWILEQASVNAGLSLWTSLGRCFGQGMWSSVHE